MTEIKLYDHQQEAVDKFKNRNQILAHEMGLGKTLTSAHIGRGDKCLVICPAKLKQSWVDELHKIHEEGIQVVHTAKDVIEDEDWTIMSYDIAQVIWEKLINKKYDHLFLDESHYIKGKFTFNKRLRKFSGTRRAGVSVVLANNIDHVILMTGTPIMNRPIELWNQLVAVGAKITKEMSRTSFSKIYCGGHLKQMGPYRFWWENGATRLEELRERINDDIDIIRKKDVLDLPEKVINRKIIELSGAEQKEYDKAWEEYIAYIEQHPEYDLEDIENVVRAQHLVEVQKLSQITSRVKAKNAIEDLENLAPDEQVVIFAEYVATIEELNKALKKKKIKYSTIKDEGAVQKFQKKEVQIFTSNIIAGGTGLNLQNANMVWIIDENWTPAINQQAEDRIHRIGQEKSSFITYYEVYGTVDERRREANTTKRKIIDKILETHS